MNLEHYWRFFAEKNSPRVDLNVYENGWFSTNKTLYNDKAERFECEGFREFVALPHGNFAILHKENRSYGWSVYRKNGEKVARLKKDTLFLQNGFAQQERGDDVIIFNPFSETEMFNLGPCDIDDVCGVGDLLIYTLRVRRTHITHICKIQHGELVTLSTHNNIARPFFFKCGSYAVWEVPKNWWAPRCMFRVYNRSRQQVFASSLEKVRFNAEISDNHFFAYNGRRYKGVYSAETGQLVMHHPNVDLYFDNGSYYDQHQGLVLGNESGKVSTGIYFVQQLGPSGAVFRHASQAFVIDTDLTIEELRTRVQKERDSLSDADAQYACYLKKLLALLEPVSATVPAAQA